MTVIAYRAGIIAGDGRETMQNTPDESWFKIRDNCVKVFRLKDGSLFGAAHGSEDIEILFRHLRENPDREDMPPGLEDIIAMRVMPDGRVLSSEGGIWVPTHLEYWAIGSGGLAALCAMDAGASAERAVQIACERDLWCGGKITTLKLKR